MPKINKEYNMRCKSCDYPMEDYEITSVVSVDNNPDNDIVVQEEFCQDCLNKYVYNVDSLDSVFYALEDETRSYF